MVRITRSRYRLLPNKKFFEVRLTAFTYNYVETLRRTVLYDSPNMFYIGTLVHSKRKKDANIIHIWHFRTKEDTIMFKLKCLIR